MHRNKYLSESALKSADEKNSGTLSCHTCIAPVVRKLKNFPTVGFDHWKHGRCESLPECNAAVQLKISQPRLYTILKNREDLLRLARENENTDSNTTSLTQTCDQGLIRTLKVYHRHEMRARILESFEDNEEISANDLYEKTTLLEAVHLLTSSWNRISADTIRNCFAHGRFCEALEEKL
ncbi:hypothetical protein AVEN_50721-1 [Araneus ventricosus]|uniref:DDE-1 domain-containing protein n=1 Tax=Araneus ventricosus TaxID=182803 RepID=A0A4Y2HYE7_ARAVE|nr:hypothetical protein AVEN_50721-1 [Araneus ventricosus]